MTSLTKQLIALQALLFVFSFLPLAHAESPGSDSKSSLKAQTSATASPAALTVEVIGAQHTDKESEEVLHALKKLLTGLEHQNFDAIADCLSEDVTQIDAKNRVLYGKKEVLENIKKNIFGSDKKRPVVDKIVVYNPFIRVKGDMAMVSFRAMKELSGERPTKMESWCSEIFERKNGQWLILQLKTNWQPMRLSAK